MNADEVEYLNASSSAIANNLFAYCFNNPVNKFDAYGNMPPFAAVAASAKQLAGFALFAFLILYVADENTRDWVNGALNSVFAALINAAGYLFNVINDVIKNARRGKRYKGNETHHIVAKKDPRAMFSRSILEGYDINVNDPINLVVIKNSLHRYLHTSSYHFSVNLYIKICELRGKDYNTKKQNVYAALLTISVLLQMASMKL